MGKLPKLLPITYDDFDLLIDGPGVTAIGRLTLAWSRLDSMLTVWFANESKADFEVTFIVIGRLEVKGKLDKLADLFELTGDDGKLDYVKDLRKQTTEPTKLRNIVAHAMCLGTYKTDPTAIGYLSFIHTMRTQDGPRVPVAKVPIKHVENTAALIDRLTADLTAKYIPPSESVPPSRLFPAPPPTAPS